MATIVLKSPVVRPPWTTRPPTRVLAANAAAKCKGFRSPDSTANVSTSSGVKVRVKVARDPTAGGCQPMLLAHERGGFGVAYGARTRNLRSHNPMHLGPNRDWPKGSYQVLTGTATGTGSESASSMATAARRRC